MKTPGLGPKAKRLRQSCTKKEWMQRMRAEERFDARGRDGDETQSECGSELESEDEALDTPEMQINPEAERDTPKAPKAKRKRTKAPRNVEQEALQVQLMEENFEDPYFTMSEKDDSDFGTDASLTDAAADSDMEGPQDE